jgi:hypothetical protein
MSKLIVKEHNLAIFRAQIGAIMYNPFLDIFINNFNTPWYSYNIYILSDESLNSGDWFYDFDSRSIKAAFDSIDKIKYKGYKIIASTNNCVTELPGIPNEFVLEYIRLKNKGVEIKKVMVEYEHVGNQSYEIEEGKTDDYPVYCLNVNEDNLINIYISVD